MQMECSILLMGNTVKWQGVTFITMCCSIQFDFNLVRNPTPEKQFSFLFLFRKKHPQAGFELGSPTTN